MAVAGNPEDFPPTIVTFEVRLGDRWKDPDGETWEVVKTGPGGVVLERPITRQVTYRDLVRDLRLEGCPHDAYEENAKLGALARNL